MAAAAWRSVAARRTKLRTPVGYSSTSSPGSPPVGVRVSPVYVFEGLIMASGPSVAWFVIGISKEEQNE